MLKCPFCNQNISYKYSILNSFKNEYFCKKYASTLVTGCFAIKKDIFKRIVSMPK